MKKFVIVIPKDIVRYFICHGEELRICKTCKARFSCYTGEIPYPLFSEMLSSCLAKNYHKVTLYSEVLELSIFGEIKSLIKITHNDESVRQYDAIH